MAAPLFMNLSSPTHYLINLVPSFSLRNAPTRQSSFVSPLSRYIAPAESPPAPPLFGVGLLHTIRNPNSESVGIPLQATLVNMLLLIIGPPKNLPRVVVVSISERKRLTLLLEPPLGYMDSLLPFWTPTTLMRLTFPVPSLAVPLTVSPT